MPCVCVLRKLRALIWIGLFRSLTCWSLDTNTSVREIYWNLFDNSFQQRERMNNRSTNDKTKTIPMKNLKCAMQTSSLSHQVAAAYKLLNNIDISDLSKIFYYRIQLFQIQSAFPMELHSQQWLGPYFGGGGIHCFNAKSQNSGRKNVSRLKNKRFFFLGSRKQNQNSIRHKSVRRLSLRARTCRLQTLVHEYIFR